MSDRDTGHTLVELQEARAEVDRLRELVRWRDVESELPGESGFYETLNDSRHPLPRPEYFHELEHFPLMVKYWRPIGPLPGGE